MFRSCLRLPRVSNGKQSIVEIVDGIEYSDRIRGLQGFLLQSENSIFLETNIYLRKLVAMGRTHERRTEVPYLPFRYFNKRTTMRSLQRFPPSNVLHPSPCITICHCFVKQKTSRQVSHTAVQRQFFTSCPSFRECRLSSSSPLKPMQDPKHIKPIKLPGQEITAHRLSPLHLEMQKPFSFLCQTTELSSSLNLAKCYLWTFGDRQVEIIRGSTCLRSRGRDYGGFTHDSIS